MDCTRKTRSRGALAYPQITGDMHLRISYDGAFGLAGGVFGGVFGLAGGVFGGVFCGVTGGVFCGVTGGVLKCERSGVTNTQYISIADLFSTYGRLQRNIPVWPKSTESPDLPLRRP